MRSASYSHHLHSPSSLFFSFVIILGLAATTLSVSLYIEPLIYDNQNQDLL